MAKGERDWAQLDAFEAEYRDRLRAEKKRKDSQFLTYLNRIARGRETFWSDEINARDPESGRLFALRGKILNLREKVGLPDEKVLPVEGEFVGKTTADTARSPDDLFDADGKKLTAKGKAAIRFVIDPAPEGSLYPVTIEEIKAVLAELPVEHTAPIHEIRLSNQQRTGADGDWLEGEIRLHCLVQTVEPVGPDGPEIRRLMGRREGGTDVERWGDASPGTETARSRSGRARRIGPSFCDVFSCMRWRTASPNCPAIPTGCDAQAVWKSSANSTRKTCIPFRCPIPARGAVAGRRA